MKKLKYEKKFQRSWVLYDPYCKISLRRIFRLAKFVSSVKYLFDQVSVYGQLYVRLIVFQTLSVRPSVYQPPIGQPPVRLPRRYIAISCWSGIVSYENYLWLPSSNLYFKVKDSL